MAECEVDDDGAAARGRSRFPAPAHAHTHSTLPPSTTSAQQPDPAASVRQGHGRLAAESERRRGKVLPFEFMALEVCLEYACKSLEHEASMLEKEAYPALDELTSRVSTLNLEHEVLDVEIEF